MRYQKLLLAHALHKVIVIAAVSLLGSLVTIAQTNIAVAPNKLNVLYVGVDNPVSIAASNGSDDQVTVSISGGGGTISKIGTGLFNVRVSEMTNDCVVSVYVNEKLAGTSSFRVRNLPAPFGSIGGFKSGENVEAGVFKTQSGLAVYVQDSPFDLKYEVVSYTFSVNTDRGDEAATHCQGSLFSSTAKEYINQYVKPGRTVIIDKIRVKDAGGREMKLPSLLYYIK